ncbi:putative sec1-like protein [Plasmopara halstedii]
MSSVVNLAEEVLNGVLQAAEHLRGAIIAAENGCIESLRWSGAMPLLLRDFGVQNVLSASDLLNCASSKELRHLLLLQETETVDHVALLLSDFLWNYEKALKRLLTLDVIHRLTICSSISEKAHECYDFSKAENNMKDSAMGTKISKEMKFHEFALEVKTHVTFEMEKREKLSLNEANDWDWNDLDTTRETFMGQNRVQVIHLPLSMVPLLYSKTSSPEPSVFVLSQPTCASAFPLLLHQVENNKLTAPTSPTKHDDVNRRKYLHVKNVVPEDIPSAFRCSMRLLAYTIAEIMFGARLDVKDRIFALGATSLKIGHTLLRILNEMQQDSTSQDQKSASILIIDRTTDVISPSSFGDSLLDRVLALLPQTPTKSIIQEDFGVVGSTTRQENVTEIYPLHGCEPTPLAALADTSSYQTSNFVSQIQWKGGANLCHPTIDNGLNVFRSLAFRPAKLALRDLDKRLQSIEQTLLQQGNIQATAVTRRPGEKVRGRDVVLRRISKILEAGEPMNLEHSSLIELGVIVLETLERMEKIQMRWNKCRERAVRHFELWKQGESEWILPEYADVMQRQIVATDEENFSLQESLILLVNAFARSSGTPLEDYTLQMVQKTLVEIVWQAVQKAPLSLQAVLPKLYTQLLPYIHTHGLQTKTDCDIEDDNWDWNENNVTPTTVEQFSHINDNKSKMVETRSIIETYVEKLMSILEDCKQQCAKLSDSNDSPRSLLAQLCSSIVDSCKAPVEEIEHVVDASEQLTRAGINLLKSGFSKFGFRGSSESAINGNRIGGSADVIIVFIVGGITFEEIQEVHDVLSENTKYQVILGGTAITNSDMIIEKLFTS